MRRLPDNAKAVSYLKHTIYDSNSDELRNKTTHRPAINWDGRISHRPQDVHGTPTTADGEKFSPAASDTERCSMSEEHGQYRLTAKPSLDERGRKKGNPHPPFAQPKGRKVRYGRRPSSRNRTHRRAIQGNGAVKNKIRDGKEVIGPIIAGNRKNGMGSLGKENQAPTAGKFRQLELERTQAKTTRSITKTYYVRERRYRIKTPKHNMPK